jgi:uncharacterized protein YceK
MAKAAIGLLAATTLLASGCGTALNLYLMGIDDSAVRVYGGVRFDAVAVRGAFLGPPEGVEDSSGLAGPIEKLLGALILMDLPLSAAADTATLPFTLCCALHAAQYQSAKGDR